jgi:hypothetical protein
MKMQDSGNNCKAKFLKKPEQWDSEKCLIRQVVTSKEIIE